MIPDLTVAPWMLYVSIAVSVPMMSLGAVTYIREVSAGNFWWALAGFAWFVTWGVVLGAAVEAITF